MHFSVSHTRFRLLQHGGVHIRSADIKAAVSNGEKLPLGRRVFLFSYKAFIFFECKNKTEVTYEGTPLKHYVSLFHCIMSSVITSAVTCTPGA